MVAMSLLLVASRTAGGETPAVRYSMLNFTISGPRLPDDELVVRDEGAFGAVLPDELRAFPLVGDIEAGFEYAVVVGADIDRVIPGAAEFELGIEVEADPGDMIPFPSGPGDRIPVRPRCHGIGRWVLLGCAGVGVVISVWWLLFGWCWNHW